MNSRSISGVGAPGIDAGACSGVRSVAGPRDSACGCGSVRDVASCIGVCRGKGASGRIMGDHRRILQSRHRATCGMAHRTHRLRATFGGQPALYAGLRVRYVASQYKQMLNSEPLVRGASASETLTQAPPGATVADDLTSHQDFRVARSAPQYRLSNMETTLRCGNGRMAVLRSRWRGMELLPA